MHTLNRRIILSSVLGFILAVFSAFGMHSFISTKSLLGMVLGSLGTIPINPLLTLYLKSPISKPFSNLSPALFDLHFASVIFVIWTALIFLGLTYISPIFKTKAKGYIALSLIYGLLLITFTFVGFEI